MFFFLFLFFLEECRRYQDLNCKSNRKLYKELDHLFLLDEDYGNLESDSYRGSQDQRILLGDKSHDKLSSRSFVVKSFIFCPCPQILIKAKLKSNGLIS